MVRFPRCIDCKKFIELNEEGKYTCKAFPDGIPDDVFWGKIDHTENIDGDNGIKFEEIS